MATFSATRRGVTRQLAEITDAASNPRVMLMSDTHDFDAAVTALTASDVNTDEVSPTNYARQTLVFSGAITIDSDERAVITWTDTSFGILGPALNATIGGAYIVDDTGDDTTSDLLYRIPFAEVQTTDGTVFTVRWGTPTAKVRP